MKMFRCFLSSACEQRSRYGGRTHSHDEGGLNLRDNDGGKDLGERGSVRCCLRRKEEAYGDEKDRKDSVLQVNDAGSEVKERKANEKRNGDVVEEASESLRRQESQLKLVAGQVRLT